MHALPPPRTTALSLVQPIARVAYELPRSQAALQLDLHNLKTMLSSYAVSDPLKLLTAANLLAAGRNIETAYHLS